MRCRQFIRGQMWPRDPSAGRRTGRPDGRRRRARWRAGRTPSAWPRVRLMRSRGPFVSVSAGIGLAVLVGRARAPRRRRRTRSRSRRSRGRSARRQRVLDRLVQLELAGTGRRRAGGRPGGRRGSRPRAATCCFSHFSVTDTSPVAGPAGRRCAGRVDPTVPAVNASTSSKLEVVAHDAPHASRRPQVASEPPVELTVSTIGPPVAVRDGGDRARRDDDALEQVEVGAERVGDRGLDRVGVGDARRPRRRGALARGGRRRRRCGSASR